MDVSDESDPFDRDRYRLVRLHPIGKIREFAGSENFVGLGCSAEFGSEIDWLADVIITFEEECDAARQADSHLQVGFSEMVDQVGTERYGCGWVDADDHDAITQPLRDPDTSFRSHITSDAAKLTQTVSRPRAGRVDV